MKALYKSAAAPGLTLVERPEPTPGPGDVKIRVLRTGICGTDLHIESWDDWAAVAYYSQSFRFLPTEARTLYSRFVALDRIPGGAQWAIRDLRRAVALKPGEASYNFWLARLLHNDGEVVAARPYYLAARSDAEFDHDALWFYCTSFIDVQDDLDALLECSETLAGAYPEFGTSWMVRALALVGARDPDAPAAVARFRELADARDPRQEAMLEYLTSQGW